MFRILHFGVFTRLPKGVHNQLLYERGETERLSSQYHWDIKYFVPRDRVADFYEPINIAHSNSSIALFRNYNLLSAKAFAWLEQNHKNYDAVLLRYLTASTVQYQNRHWFSNIFTVHHTFEIDEIRLKGSASGLLLGALERFMGPRVLSDVKGIIGVTDEIINYEQCRMERPKPSYCYPNGIAIDQCPLVKDRREGVLKLLFVSSKFSPWQGLDLVLNGFSQSSEQFEVHIIGSVAPTLAKKRRYDQRFIFHGERELEYLQEIMSQCDVGIGSLALFRKGMSEAASIKVREYLCSGLCVYSGHRDAGLPDDFPYYRRGEFSVESILNYAGECRRSDRSTVRNASLKYIDKAKLMSNLAIWLRDVV